MTRECNYEPNFHLERLEEFNILGIVWLIKLAEAFDFNLDISKNAKIFEAN